MGCLVQWAVYNGKVKSKNNGKLKVSIKFNWH